MRPSTDRPAMNSVFRPSLLAWRAKYLADKANRPEAAATRPATPPADLPRGPAPRA